MRGDLLILVILSQPANTCSKITIETLEQGVKYERRQRSASFVFIIPLHSGLLHSLLSQKFITQQHNLPDEYMIL